jgi:hypothetical protein
MGYLDEHYITGDIMHNVGARWLSFYEGKLEEVSKALFSHIEKMIVGTLIVSAGSHVSSTEPGIALFGYLSHSLVGRGVELFGILLLALNFLDGLYRLARQNWNVAYQIVMTVCYIVLSARLIQLILAFRGD